MNSLVTKVARLQRPVDLKRPSSTLGPKSFLRRASRCALFLLTVVLSNLALGQPVALAQEELLTDSLWQEGFHGFASMMENSGLESYSDMAEFESGDPSDSILIILGPNSNSGAQDQLVLRFIKNGGSVLYASDKSTYSFAYNLNIQFFGGSWQTYLASHGYQIPGDRRYLSDCPVVTRLRGTPLFKNVRDLVTNQPAVIVVDSQRDAQWHDVDRGDFSIRGVAQFPPLMNNPVVVRNQYFGVEVTHQSGGKALFLSDPTILTNQMLTRGSNISFAFNTVQWLHEENRNRFLILANNEVTQPIDPDDIEFQLPPPTPEQVLAAIRNLPPSMLLELGNDLAVGAAESGLIDELMQSIPQNIYYRYLIIVATSILGAASIMFLFSSKLFFGNHEPKKRKEKKIVKRQKSMERSMAVHALIDALCIKMTHRNFDEIREFPNHIFVANGEHEDIRAVERLRKHAKLFWKKKPAYWTTARLSVLVGISNQLHRLHSEGKLTYDDGLR